MLAYEPSVQNDLQLYSWYEQLILTGDMKKQFTPGFHALSAFIGFFQDPTVLLYESDDKGFWFCMWAEPSHGNGAAVHLWIRESKRHTKAAVEATMLGLQALLVQFPLLLGITPDQYIAEEHQKIGFAFLGMIPAVDETGPSFVTYLTRESFKPIAVRRVVNE